MHELDTRRARRLALARAGLLKPEWTGLPARAAGCGRRARRAAERIVDRFGYLQLDTVSVAGARSHCLVLLSRLEGVSPELGECLLQPGEALFEYWAHEASWIPLELYPAFEFRRRAFREHPWWGNVIGRHPKVAERLRARIREEGALRSADMEGRGSRGWWDLKAARKVAAALWSSGELAIAERRNFLRSFDLVERVVPESLRARPLSLEDSLELLLEKALEGHGWATTGTLSQTFRLRALGDEVRAALSRLEERGRVEPCALRGEDGRRRRGWIRPEDLELAERLQRVRPRGDRAVLLSPFDPVLWDRGRAELLFGFHYRIGIFTPAEKRTHGYFCLPVLAGERLVGQVDLKADRKRGRLRILSRHFEADRPSPADREALRGGVERLAGSLGLTAAR